MRASANRKVWRSATLDMSVRDDDAPPANVEDDVLADLVAGGRPSIVGG